MKPRVDQQLFEFRKALQVFLVQSIDLGLCLLQGRPRLQASDVIPIIAVMQGFLFGREREWHPQANLGLNEVEVARHHADDGERPAADPQCASQNCFVSAV